MSAPDALQVRPGSDEEVKHSIDVDAEALSIRNRVDNMFQAGYTFSPMLELFRKGKRICSVVCRASTSEEDKKIAYAELGMLIPTLHPHEVVLAYNKQLKKGNSTKRGLASIIVMAANNIGMTVRVFPYFCDAKEVFTEWTEEGADADNYDPFVASVIGGFIHYNKKPYLLDVCITTLARRGHAIEIYPDNSD